MLSEAMWDIESVYAAAVCSKNNRVNVSDPAGRVLTVPKLLGKGEPTVLAHGYGHAISCIQIPVVRLD